MTTTTDHRGRTWDQEQFPYVYVVGANNEEDNNPAMVFDNLAGVPTRIDGVLALGVPHSEIEPKALIQAGIEPGGGTEPPGGGGGGDTSPTVQTTIVGDEVTVEIDTDGDGDVDVTVTTNND